jgi:N-acetylglucosamine-6-phosphate deacetylase
MSGQRGEREAARPPLMLRAACVVTGDKVFEPGFVEVEQSLGIVTALGGAADAPVPATSVVETSAPGGQQSQPPTAAGAAGAAGAVGGTAEVDLRVIDLGNRTIAAGYVDVHVHGGDGAQVNGEDPDEVCESLERIARFHATHGTTSLLATTVSDSPERLLMTVQGIARMTRSVRANGEGLGRPGVGGRKSARVVGAHLEGPFIARARTGAQDPGELRSPDLAELDRLIDAADGSLKLITLAPELPGAFDLIEHAIAAGIIVALGHTDADFETAERAYDAGARHLTHLFNAMPPLHHRRPGVIGAALRREDVTLELIADLEHVHPAVIEIIARLAPDRIVAVSDSTPAAGLGAGRHRLGTLDVTVSGRRVELADDPTTLAGSMLTIDQAVRNLVTEVGLTLPDALRAATLTPGRLVQRGLGQLAPGSPADLVILEPDLTVAATIVGGLVVHDPSGLLT